MANLSQASWQAIRMRIIQYHMQNNMIYGESIHDDALLQTFIREQVKIQFELELKGILDEQS